MKFYGVKLRREERRKEIDRNLSEVGRYDVRLGMECTYYPRPRYWMDGDWVYPCESCDFSSPLESCKRGHILEDTRVSEVETLTFLIRRNDREIKRLEVKLMKKEVK